MTSPVDVDDKLESAASVAPSMDDKKNFSRTPTSWDAEDDVLLMHLKDQQKLGWKEIASHFNNRTPNACQFRWRRLKSGNLKNPPKSAAALGSSIPKLESPQAKPLKKKASTPAGTTPTPGAGSGSTTSTPAKDYAGYNPLANPPPFTGFDNSLTNALAGLNALSNSPLPHSVPSPSSGAGTPSKPSSPPGGTSSPHRRHSMESSAVPPTTTNTYETTVSSPAGSVALDPQAHANAASTTGGGYYADVSVDPTMNLPHNQPGPPQAGTYIHTPRNSTGSIQHPPPPNMHNNSIIQIANEPGDRANSVSSRMSVSSLPSKSMNIPHGSVSGPLAHLPVLFGRDSVSGPSRHSSISGPPGIQPTIASLRSGSIVGPSGGYYSRSGSVVIPYNADKKEEDTLKQEAKKLDAARKESKDKKKPKSARTAEAAAAAAKAKSQSAPVFKLPWTMEEDELLINRRNRELSFAELSILLPQRTEGEIWSRIDHLEKIKNGHRASTSRDRRRRQSSIGLDDVDDFYEDMMGGIDVSDDDDVVDDDDDDVLVEVDDSVAMARRRAAMQRKRRASSAVNPLAVGDSIRKRYRQ
ncbi:hypothetical protein DICA1_E05446 [Diutina catenulata]